MSYTPADPHFVQSPDLDLLSHRPHKSALLLFNAVTATAVFRIWPSLLFLGAWSTMVVVLNEYTSRKVSFPNTMITVLGVLLGLTLSYRTSSAYEKYSEGRKMWSQIILASRTWARTVWIHCPDTILSVVPTDPDQRALDQARGMLEKKTVVQLALAFAVAVKHYLRGEEGIRYEDLYDLVNFIPSLDLPSALPGPEDTNIATGRVPLPGRSRTPETTPPLSKSETTSWQLRPQLRPANDPPKFRWKETWPMRLLPTQRRRQREIGKRAMRERMKADRHGGVGQNVPLEITMFMSSWIACMQRRKVVDVPTINILLGALSQMNEALSNLERILTTPIPWSYNAHIWEVSWIYCLALPFQLYASNFGWVTIPAVMITSYIVMGYGSIAEEIENPFGYDKNDLNLGFFCGEIIAKELDAITARAFGEPGDWIFSASNRLFGVNQPGAETLAVIATVSEIRGRLALAPGRSTVSGGNHARNKSSDRKRHVSAEYEA